MALRKQVIDLPFVGGRSADVSPLLVDPTKQFSELINCFQERKGELRRRNGFTKLDGLSYTTEPQRLWSINDELVALNGSAFGTYAPNTAGFGFRQSVPQIELGVDKIEADIDVTGTQNTADVATLYADGGTVATHALYVWAGSGSFTGVRYAVVDLASGAVVLTGHLGTATAHAIPLRVSSTSFGIAYYLKGANNNLLYRRIINVPTAPTIDVAATTLANDRDNLPDAKFDACESSAVGSFVVAYKKNGAENVIVTTFTAAGAQIDTATIVGNAISQVTAPALVWKSDGATPRIWCFFNDFWPAGPKLTVTKFASDLTGAVTNVVSATFTPYRQGMTAGYFGGSAYVFYTHAVAGTGGEISPNIYTATVSNAGVPSATSKVSGQCSVMSAPWFVNSVAYILVCTQGTSVISDAHRATYAIINASGELVARFFVGDAFMQRGTDATGAANAAFSSRSRCAFKSTNNYLVAALRIQAQDLGTVAWNSALYGVTINTKPVYIPAFVQNECLYFGAGVLRCYDGQDARVADLTPQINLINTITSPAGGVLAAGAYSAKVAYFWIDAKGNEHYGPEWPLLTAVAAAVNDQILFNDLEYNQLDQREFPSDIKIYFLFYRTAKDDFIYYNEAKVVNSATLSFDNLTVGTTITDAVLALRPLSRQTGGRVTTSAAPAPWYVTAAQDYGLLIPADDREAIWTSLPFEKNVAPEWSNALVARFTEGGDGMAIEVLDNRPVLFKENGVYELLGQAPNVLGQGSFNQLRTISPTAGCIDRRSIVKTPYGIVFQSYSGFHLLTRNFTIEYIGGPVADYEATMAIASAVCFETTEITQVRFTLTSGKVLVWDYSNNTWSVFTYTYGGAAVTIGGPSCIWNNHWVGALYTAAYAAGGAVEEKPTDWVDGSGGSNPTASFTTGLFRGAGNMGVQRVWRAGLIGAGGRDTVVVTATRDGGSPVTVAAAAAVTTLPVRWHLPADLQKSAALALTASFVDSSAAPTTEAGRFSGLSLECGVRPGMLKLPPGQTNL